VNLKRKYEEGSNYMEGISTPTMHQNRLIYMRGSTDPKQSHKKHTVLPTCKDKRCNFGVDAMCRSTDGSWFLSKIGSGKDHTTYHPQDLNLLTSTIDMDDATRKCIQSCSRVSATPSTTMRLTHITTGEKNSDKKMEHIFEQAKGVVCGEDIIHPDKDMAIHFLKIIDAMPNHSYLALVCDPKSELIRVNKTRVCNKKLHKEAKKGSQHFTLLTKLKGKNHPSTKHVPCTVNVPDDYLVKSTMTLDDSDEMLSFVTWGSDEDLRHIIMFPEVLSIDTTYGTNRENRPLLVFAGKLTK
jgi:hypothetical protein